MTSSVGRRQRKTSIQRGFTLLEVLAAFAVLVTGLTLIATAFTRHLHALRLLSDSVTAYRITDQTLQRELLKRREGVEVEALPLPPGFTPQIRPEQITLEIRMVNEVQAVNVVMERLRAQVTWTTRGQARSSEIAGGVVPPREEGSP